MLDMAMTSRAQNRYATSAHYCPPTGMLTDHDDIAFNMLHINHNTLLYKISGM